MPQTPVYTKGDLYTDALQMMDRPGDTNIPLDMLVRKARTEMQTQRAFKCAETTLDYDLADGDNSISEPTDLRSLYLLKLASQTDDSFVSRMTYLTKEQFDRLTPSTDPSVKEGQLYVTGRSVDDGSPRFYTRFGSTIYFYPSASGSDHRIKVDYVKYFPNDLTTQNDSYTDGLLNFMDLSLAATCWQIALFLKDTDAVQLWSGEYARLLRNQIDLDDYDQDIPQGQWPISGMTN